MKRKLFCIFTMVVMFIITSDVYAKENAYYQNKNGVKMSYVEYNNILQLNGKDVLENMSQEIFDEYKDYYSDDNLNINTNIFNDNNGISLYSEHIDTTYKTLKISAASSLSSTKMIVVTLQWKKMPKVRSYDVIGVRLLNTTFKSDIHNTVLFDGNKQSISGQKKYTNGYGASIKLPSSCSNITIQQSFKVSSDGEVFASYQHATKSISLSDSENFIISAKGLGNVFKFANNDLFDKMSGVNVSV